eukprot:1160558-Pelagomonas_calceolata.AAC.6
MLCALAASKKITLEFAAHGCTRCATGTQTPARSCMTTLAHLDLGYKGLQLFLALQRPQTCMDVHRCIWDLLWRGLLRFWMEPRSGPLQRDTINTCAHAPPETVLSTLVCTFFDSHEGTLAREHTHFCTSWSDACVRRHAPGVFGEEMLMTT